MKHLTAALCLLSPALDAATAAPAPQPNAPRPNILLILADDLGFSDLGSYGGEIRTTNLDSLAENGLRFTQVYNSSRCCPSRASLLTGVYPHQAGIGWFVGNGGLPGYRGRLSDRTVTIAEVLRNAGYTTAATGKWHVNVPGPTDRGFDDFYGFVHGYAVDSWNENMMVRLPEGAPRREYGPEEFFATDAITDHAIDFIDAAESEGDEPWFVYVGYQAPHFPLQAPPELSATYEQTYEQGWDAIRDQRLERMKQLGILDSRTELSPRGPIDQVNVAKRLGSMTEDGNNPAWDDLPADRQADLARRMSVYAAMVEGMDQGIGRLVETIREHGELDNTLIIFLSDNGACAEWEPFGFDLDAADYSSNPPGTGINGGTPGKPNILHTGEALEQMGGREGSLISYGSAWANVSNTPLRLYKHYAHEGGIRTPMIVHWPAAIRERNGLRDQVAHIMDILPTCLEVAGAEFPAERDGRETLAPEGVSLLPAFSNEPLPERALVFEHERNAAVRDGDWKLVAQNIVAGDGLREGVEWELYNLREDPTEQHDLADRYPERVRAMEEFFLREARRTHIVPRP